MLPETLSATYEGLLTMRVLAALTAASVCIASIAAQAPHERAAFAAYGPFHADGSEVTCGALTRASADVKETYEWWMMGFVSGAGRESVLPLARTDTAGITAWTTHYCSAHPLESLLKAGIVLVDELAVRAKQPQQP